MNRHKPRLPHELYIKALFWKGFSIKEVEGQLQDYDLAIPIESYMEELKEQTKKKPEHEIKKLIESDFFIAAEELLDCNHRELLDAMCVLHVETKEKAFNELVELGIFIPQEVFYAYKRIFWNTMAVNSRTRWKEFIRCLPEDTSGDKQAGTGGYKDILRLARMGKNDLLFWRLQIPNKKKSARELLESARELSFMRLMETQFMPNEESVSRIAANYGNLIGNLSRQLLELEASAGYQEVAEMLTKGLVEIESKEGNYKSLSEVNKENDDKEKSKVVALPNKKGKAKNGA